MKNKRLKSSVNVMLVICLCFSLPHKVQGSDSQPGETKPEFNIQRLDLSKTRITLADRLRKLDSIPKDEITRPTTIAVSVLQSISVLFILTIAEVAKSKLHERHLSPTPVSIKTSVEEAVKEIIEDRQIFFQAGDRVLNAPIPLILSEGVHPIIDRLVSNIHFRNFLSSATVGFIFSFGLEAVTQLVQMVGRHVMERVEKYGLTEPQVAYLNDFVTPTKYSNSSLLGGLISNNPDVKIVHRILLDTMFSYLLLDKDFVNAFFGYVMRQQLTGDAVTRFAAIAMNVWAYTEISALILNNPGLLVKAAAQLGVAQAPAVVGLGLVQGTVVGLATSTVLGMAIARINKHSKNMMTFGIRDMYLRAADVLSFLKMEASNLKRDLFTTNGRRDPNVPIESELSMMREQRDRLLINTTDLLKITIESIDAVSVDLVLAEEQLKLKTSSGKMSYYFGEALNLIEGFFVNFFAEPEPSLVETIRRDKLLLDMYANIFQRLSHRLIEKYNIDENRIKKIIRHEYDRGNVGIISELHTELHKINAMRGLLKQIVVTLAKTSLGKRENDKNYFKVRDIVTQIHFWSVTEERIYEELQKPTPTNKKNLDLVLSNTFFGFLN